MASHAPSKLTTTAGELQMAASHPQGGSDYAFASYSPPVHTASKRLSQPYYHTSTACPCLFWTYLLGCTHTHTYAHMYTHTPVS